MTDVAGSDHASAIRTRREASNRAIAARDPDLVVLHMMHDVSVSVANGPTLTGRAANRDAFAEQFADRTFRGYVREPSEVFVHQPPTRATERGRWKGSWRKGMSEQVVRGTYIAEWHHTELGWFIQSEVFVPSAT